MVTQLTIKTRMPHIDRAVLVVACARVGRLRGVLRPYVSRGLPTMLGVLVCCTCYPFGAISQLIWIALLQKRSLIAWPLLLVPTDSAQSWQRCSSCGAALSHPIVE